MCLMKRYLWILLLVAVGPVLVEAGAEHYGASWRLSPWLTYWSTLGLLYATLRYVQVTQGLLNQSAAQTASTEAMTRLTSRDLVERYRPLVVTLTNLDQIPRSPVDMLNAIPVFVRNVGVGTALNVTAWASFSGSYASEPPQPFKIPSLAPGENALLGEMHGTGNNPARVVLRQMEAKIECEDVFGNRYRTVVQQGTVKLEPVDRGAAPSVGS